jgi:hypothetical protein
VVTAIVSDLHLGLADGRALLSRPPAMDALAAAVAGADELVLLGDLLELRERPVARVLAEAVPTLEELGRRAAGKRLTIVPGNHDHQLAQPLLESLRARDGDRAQLALDTTAAPPSDGPLGAVARALNGAGEVRIAYPGLWVRPDVYATHGHYLDVHNTVPTFERIAIGAVQRAMGRLPDGQLTPDDYEAALGPVYALTYALAQSARGERSVAGGTASVRLWQFVNSGGSGDRKLLRRLPGLAVGAVALPAAVGALNLAGLGPLKPDLSGVELRRAGLRGMAESVRRLGIEADHVLFGHTHRSGPHPGDEGWGLPGGGRLMNIGSWIHEPAFLGSSPRESPYWPGHVAIVAEDGPPRLLSLLEELPL